jgi:hypothetical protein
MVTMDPIKRRQQADRRLARAEATSHEARVKAAQDLAAALRVERDRLLTPLVRWLSQRLRSE